ncbi:MAG: helix-turn-helix transcriptional regulator [Bacteroidales bacterium]|nr:helix-turn-helix transcriptional regulator [Bacteroidales bacterium]
MYDYSEMIRSLRVRRGYTQEAMADAMGVQRSTYGRFERGEIKIFTTNFIKFMKVLEIDPEEVICPDEGTFLSDRTFQDKVDDLAEEVRDLRKIIEMLAARIEKLSPSKK